MEKDREEEKEELNKEINDLLSRPKFLSDKYANFLDQLYLQLNSCSADTLALIALTEFDNLADMDRAISKGKFLTAFAKRLSVS